MADETRARSVQFPGSRLYDSFGKIDNAAELGEDVDPKSIVKVSGSKAAVAAAIEELSVSPAPSLSSVTSRDPPSLTLKSVLDGSSRRWPTPLPRAPPVRPRRRTSPAR